jgi:hypothetical protein
MDAPLRPTSRVVGGREAVSGELQGMRTCWHGYHKAPIFEASLRDYSLSSAQRDLTQSKADAYVLDVLFIFY